MNGWQNACEQKAMDSKKKKETTQNKRNPMMRYSNAWRRNTAFFFICFPENP